MQLDQDRKPISIDIDAQPHEVEAVKTVFASVISSNNLVQNTTNAMGLLDFLFGKKTTNKAAHSPNTINPSAKADIQSEDSFITINSLDYFGM